MTRSITAIIAFRLLPGSRARWMVAWQDLHNAASREPACRRFRLLRDRQDELHFLVLSEWGSAAAFNTFIREAGVIWLERCLDGTSEPITYAMFEGIPFEAEAVTKERIRAIDPVS